MQTYNYSTMETILFFIRKDESHPKDVRVVFEDNLYKVQFHHEPTNSWIGQGVYGDRSSAIDHALGEYHFFQKQAEASANNTITVVELILCYSTKRWNNELFIEIEDDSQIDEAVELFRDYVNENPSCINSEDMGELVHVGFYSLLEGTEEELPTIDYIVIKIGGQLQLVNRYQLKDCQKLVNLVHQFEEV